MARLCLSSIWFKPPFQTVVGPESPKRRRVLAAFFSVPLLLSIWESRVLSFGSFVPTSDKSSTWSPENMTGHFRQNCFKKFSAWAKIQWRPLLSELIERDIAKMPPRSKVSHGLSQLIPQSPQPHLTLSPLSRTRKIIVPTLFFSAVSWFHMSYVLQLK